MQLRILLRIVKHGGHLTARFAFRSCISHREGVLDRVWGEKRISTAYFVEEINPEGVDGRSCNHSFTRKHWQRDAQDHKYQIFEKGAEKGSVLNILHSSYSFAERRRS